MKFQPTWLGGWVIKQASSQSLQRSHLPHLSKHFPSSSHQGGADCRGGSEHNDVDASTYVSGHDRC